VTVVPVASAREMHEASLAEAGACDLFIAAAAVADYRPEQMAEQKLKKTGSDTLTLTLVKNPDIVTDVAMLPNRPRVVVGFAAESERVLEHARDKRQRKHLDVIIANDISEAGIGFESDDNAVTVIDETGEQTLARCSKRQLARQLIDLLARRLADR
jgi:phosphopantothenoylcysteine decarboxylase/phosphopantothenate--cysteine ligase